MRLDEDDPTRWSVGGLCKHYYHCAGEMMLWSVSSDAVEAKRRRKSIHIDAIHSGSVGGSKGRRCSVRLPGAVLLKIEEAAPQIQSGDGGSCEISPLKELLLEKRPTAKKLRAFLQDLSGRSRWLDASLDSTPPPMPTPLFHAVAAVNVEVVEVLLEFRCNVTSHYTGTSMLKGWIRPDAPLIDSVRSRKARFVGTMLGDRLGQIESMLERAAMQENTASWTGGSLFESICSEFTRTASDGSVSSDIVLSEQPSSIDIQAPALDEGRLALFLNVAAGVGAGAAGAAGRARRKSFFLPTVVGAIEHTHDHPIIKYEIVDKFSDTSRSSVRNALNVDSGAAANIKAAKKFSDITGRDPEAETWNEIYILRKLDHPNTMKLIETFEDETHIFMVFGVCSGGDLYHRLLRDGAFEVPTAMRLACQIGSAVAHLHSLQICHRDIQPEVFMLSNPGPLDGNILQITEFATAKEYGMQALVTRVCTLHYVAPEVLTSTAGYNERVDVWSFAVVLYVMIAGFPPFNMDDDIDTLHAVKAGKYSFEPQAKWNSDADDARNLIKEMLVVDPAARLSSAGVMASAAMEAAAVLHAAALATASTTVYPEDVYDGSAVELRSLFASLADGISDDQFEDLRAFVKELDEDGSGTVGFDGCCEFLRTLCTQMPGGEMLVTRLSKISGRFNYKMYLATIEDRRRTLRWHAAHAVFALFDLDSNGKVSLYEIAQALGQISENDLPNNDTVSAREVFAVWQEVKLTYQLTDGDKSDNQRTPSKTVRPTLCAHKSQADLMARGIEELTFTDFFEHLPRCFNRSAPMATKGCLRR